MSGQRDRLAVCELHRAALEIERQDAQLYNPFNLLVADGETAHVDLRFEKFTPKIVLIYFDRTSKQVVINNLLSALAPGGYLVVGPSEGVYDMLGQLQTPKRF